jgi:hypothetical protein
MTMIRLRDRLIVYLYRDRDNETIDNDNSVGNGCGVSSMISTT